MGCGDACPFIPGKRYLDWELTDPKASPSTKSAPSATTSAGASSIWSASSTQPPKQHEKQPPTGSRYPAFVLAQRRPRLGRVRLTRAGRYRRRLWPGVSARRLPLCRYLVFGRRRSMTGTSERHAWTLLVGGGSGGVCEASSPDVATPASAKLVPGRRRAAAVRSPSPSKPGSTDPVGGFRPGSGEE